MSYKVVVDYDLCESNAICMNIAPEVFEVRDDDFLYLLTETPGDELRAKVEESAERCPKQAISIAEGDGAAAEGDGAAAEGDGAEEE